MKVIGGGTYPVKLSQQKSKCNYKHRKKYSNMKATVHGYSEVNFSTYLLRRALSEAVDLPY